MGNHPSMEGVPASSSAGGGGGGGGEPLESYLREKQRDEHLKNLGFKRNKSLRRSISKRLRRARGKASKKEKEEEDRTDARTDENTDPNRRREAEASTATVERLDRTAEAEDAVVVVGTKQKRQKKQLVGDQPQPFPTHVQQVEETHNFGSFSQIISIIINTKEQKKTKKQ